MWHSNWMIQLSAFKCGAPLKSICKTTGTTSTTFKNLELQILSSFKWNQKLRNPVKSRRFQALQSGLLGQSRFDDYQRYFNCPADYQAKKVLPISSVACISIERLRKLDFERKFNRFIHSVSHRFVNDGLATKTFWTYPKWDKTGTLSQLSCQCGASWDWT